MSVEFKLPSPTDPKRLEKLHKLFEEQYKRNVVWDKAMIAAQKYQTQK